MHLELTHLTPHTGDDGYAFKRFPCIQVLVSSPDSPEPDMMKFMWALVDTGADYIFVDRAFMLAEGGKPISVRPVNATSTGMIFNATIAVPNLLGPSTIQVCGIDLDPLHVPYQVVLGRQFLANFRLEYDLANGVHRLSPSRPPEPHANIV